MRVCDPERIVRIAAHALWRRRRAIYYAVSAASLAGNFIILAGLLEVWGALAGCGLLFYDLWPHLLELCALLTHRSVLYLLLNIILVRIVVKSGVLGAPTPQPDDSPDTYQISSKMQWPATFLHGSTDAALNAAFRDMKTLRTAVATTVRQSPAASNSMEVYQSAALFGASLDIVLHDQKHDENQKSIKNAVSASIKKPMAIQLGSPSPTIQQRPAKSASLFTIEPLEMLTDDEPHGATHVVGGEQVERPDQVDHTSPEKTIEAPLRKVRTRAAILDHQLGLMEEPTCRRPSHDDENESLQLVIKYDRDAGALLLEDELSSQELMQKADTFITKFKRNLTMQRQDSLNRLLGLVEIGEIKLAR